jgi:hypothetical protein
MRRYHHVIFNRRVMADVIAAPHDHVIADADKWLDCIVLKDKAVVSAFQIRPRRCFGADVADELISAAFRLVIFVRANMIHLFEADWNEHGKLVRGIKGLDLIERDNRKIFEKAFVEELAIYRKRNDLVM